MSRDSISHFTLLEHLGSGGMGVVYRARDNKLDRPVALKFVSARSESDADARNRLLREARAAAALSHANICTIYEVGEVQPEEGVTLPSGQDLSTGMPFIAMELIEGQSLDVRLAQGKALSLREALRIASQVAEGIEAAHELGIVHRDLKPANVIVTTDGVAKILDFGLAHGDGGRAQPYDSSDALTKSLALTAPGVIMGTYAYMSPEQARGEKVDRRADIWAFGCLLYEMLSGTRAFNGRTPSDTLAEVLHNDPDWSRLPDTVSPAIRSLLRRCLTRELRRRLQAIGDARVTIEEELEGGPARDSAVPASSPWWRRAVPWVLLPMAVIGGWLVERPAAPPAPRAPAHFEVEMPPGRRFTPDYHHGLAFSPDGQELAFVAGKAHNYWAPPESTSIRLRPLAQLQSRPVEGTDGGNQPFFSPDGAWLGFIVQNSFLKKVRVTGGEPMTICECDASLGATWGPDGTIVFAGYGSPLKRVSAAGGEVVPLTVLQNDETGHGHPCFLPDGKSVLFTASGKADVATGAEWTVSVVSLESGERKTLVRNARDPHLLPTGHLVFARDDRLFAVRFDTRKLEVMGRAVPVLDGVAQSILTGYGSRETGVAQFAISSSGAMAYAAGSVFPELKRNVIEVDRQGLEQPLDIEAKAYLSARVSADGRSILLTTNYGGRHVWLYDRDRRTLRRQTFENIKNWAIWGPRTDEFTFSTPAGGGATQLKSRAVDVGPDGTSSLLSDNAGYGAVSSWSPQGELLFVDTSEETGSDIWVRRTSGVLEPLLATRFEEAYPEFSPDGRWLLYTSDESGREEVFVRPYPGPGATVQISVGGGEAPSWSRSGREIFYRDMRRGYYAVPVDLDGEKIRPREPVEAISQKWATGYPVRLYDVTPAGTFVMISAVGKTRVASVVEELCPDRIQVVSNWTDGLRDLLREAQ